MTDEENTEAATEEVDEEISFADFLVHVAPLQWKKVSSVRKTDWAVSESRHGEIATPDIRLHCPDDECMGARFLDTPGNRPESVAAWIACFDT